MPWNEIAMTFKTVSKYGVLSLVTTPGLCVQHGGVGGMLIIKKLSLAMTQVLGSQYDLGWGTWKGAAW